MWLVSGSWTFEETLRCPKDCMNILFVHVKYTLADWHLSTTFVPRNVRCKEIAYCIWCGGHAHKTQSSDFCTFCSQDSVFWLLYVLLTRLSLLTSVRFTPFAHYIRVCCIPKKYCGTTIAKCLCLERNVLTETSQYMHVLTMCCKWWMGTVKYKSEQTVQD